MSFTVHSKHVSTMFEYELTGWADVEIIAEGGKAFHDRANRLRVTVQHEGTVVDAWSPVRGHWSPLTAKSERIVLAALGVPV